MRKIVARTRGLIPKLKPLFDRGYTVFAVVHDSEPKFAIPEIPDRRLVRRALATGRSGSEVTGAGQR